MKIVLAWLALVPLLLWLNGCFGLPRQSVLPDPNVGHRVAVETTVQVWVRRPDGQLVVQVVRLLPGWYIFSPTLIDPPKGTNP